MKLFERLFNIYPDDIWKINKLIEDFDIEEWDLAEQILENYHGDIENFCPNVIYSAIYNFIKYENNLSDDVKEKETFPQWDCFINGAWDTHFYSYGEEVRTLDELKKVINNHESEGVEQ